MIPIVINNRNRLTMLKGLIDSLVERGYTNIHILDNQSTYEPLLDYYKECPYTIHYLPDNMGQAALWVSGTIRQFKKLPYIVYTDSDIELNPNTPKGFIEQLARLIPLYNVSKAGLAIEYRDLPDTPANRQSVKIEERYWGHRLLHPLLEVYKTYIDTTFAVIKTDITYSWKHPAVRVAGDYLCRHLPWYLDYNNLNEEEQFYLTQADSRYCSNKKLMGL